MADDDIEPLTPHGRLKIDWHWLPSGFLRSREMILEQLFLGTAVGQPMISEWRPVEALVTEAMG